jgi:hypothetical protein
VAEELLSATAGAVIASVVLTVVAIRLGIVVCELVMGNGEKGNVEVEEEDTGIGVSEGLVGLEEWLVREVTGCCMSLDGLPGD